MPFLLEYSCVIYNYQLKFTLKILGGDYVQT